MATVPSVLFAGDGSTVTVDGMCYALPDRTYPWGFAQEGRVFHADNFRPLQAILDAMEATDILYLAPGIYQQAITLPSGVIVTCEPGCLGQPVLSPPDAWFSANPGSAVVTFAGSEDTVLNGIGIVGGLGRPGVVSDKYGANGITFQQGAGRGCEVTNCWITAAAHCGIKEMHHRGTGIRAYNNLIWGCGQTINDHGIYCPASACRFSNNLIWNNAGAGVHLYNDRYGPAEVEVLGNVLWGNKTWGILLAGRDCLVRHNTVAGNGQGLMYFRGNCLGNAVDHNIVAFNGTDGAWDNSGSALTGINAPSGNVDDSNCYYPGKPDFRLGSQVGTHEVYADPAFRDRTRYDFRLASNSAALGKGAF